MSARHQNIRPPQRVPPLKIRLPPPQGNRISRPACARRARNGTRTKRRRHRQATSRGRDNINIRSNTPSNPLFLPLLPHRQTRQIIPPQVLTTEIPFPFLPRVHQQTPRPLTSPPPVLRAEKPRPSIPFITPLLMTFLRRISRYFSIPPMTLPPSLPPSSSPPS